MRDRRSRSAISAGPSLTVRPVNQVTPDEIRGRWDAIALERDHQIRAGEDISMVHIVVPAVLRLCKEHQRRWTPCSMLDAVQDISANGSRSGIRASWGLIHQVFSIDIAKSHSHEVEYFASSIEEFSDERR